ncbi:MULTISPECIES: sugar ABC transporter permease [unclassified Undibacterium]|uniref:carbohydrate ABC transporter permease n=1 Tax=unclassified Undibacterium TaxID=2630295 RepID=UPI002AC9A8F3|nr:MULTISPECIES: sugar ABC transporter permease [unclassified Undibacterium]MEB0140875.1 sugar ABC transporter permease [Undibacterium sp. CCC2.1]MEB0173841.1 sugar ABC transporter permease [Undibacterium sp. CCC1.1]MEB0177842.1 sugar ABC transporter permease [Undibacterium sp. CCC3.4]MEB0217047.1 sugar ABC transporter permease [Undibacterium sp. 5I2]WPX44642.1 sugar ABC transporter permease [Undibacterium sp. CCC3.4]
MSVIPPSSTTLSPAQSQASLPDRLRSLADLWLPRLVLSPTVFASLLFVYGFIAFTAYLSLTDSRIMPNYELTGFGQYQALFDLDRWWVSAANLGIFGSLFILICLAVGLALAVFLDQKIRLEGALRAIYLYPMALSFIVTGAAWKWILNPGLGLEKMVREWGFPNFSMDWLVDSDFAIYTVVIAGVWQSSGFVMALFLAGLRGVDDSIIKAAMVDGASLPTIYRRIVIPALRPVFFSVLLVLSHIAIKSFDLVMALTAGGPGTSSDVPAIFMYQFSFTRGQLGLGAASAMMMLMTVLAVLVPLIYLETKEARHGH